MLTSGLAHKKMPTSPIMGNLYSLALPCWGFKSNSNLFQSSSASKTCITFNLLIFFFFFFSLVLITQPPTFSLHGEGFSVTLGCLYIGRERQITFCLFPPSDSLKHVIRQLMILFYFFHPCWILLADPWRKVAIQNRAQKQIPILKQYLDIFIFVCFYYQLLVIMWGNDYTAREDIN